RAATEPAGAARQPRDRAARARPPGRGARELRPRAQARAAGCGRASQPGARAGEPQATLRGARELRPRAQARARCARDATLARLFRPRDALPDFARSIALRPDYAEAFTNAGIALRGLGRYQEALNHLDRALSIRPNDVTATWTKALLKLAMGEFRDGWPLYESRLQLAHMRQLQRTFAAPRWTGAQPLAGKTLLVHADEGLG